MDENLNNSFLNDRIFILVDKNVSAKLIIEEKISKKCNLNTVNELFIDDNSNIDLIHYTEKPLTTQIYNFSSLIKNNSCLNIFPIDISGKLIKKNYFICGVDLNKNLTFMYTLLLSNRYH